MNHLDTAHTASAAPRRRRCSLEHVISALSAPLVLLLAVGCGPRPAGRLQVVASTADISAIVRAVGGDSVFVTTVAPATLCPGHFDIPPSAVAAANNAELLLSHGWETWLPGFEQALANPRLRKVKLATAGNWMVPAVHRAAVEEIAVLLAEADTASAPRFRRAADRYRAKVDTVAGQARGRLAGRQLPRVIGAEHQAPLLRWLDFPVVATYGRPEEFTAAELTRLARLAVDSSVGLFVDNLQSGPDAGTALAEAAGARHVTLTNFPLDDDYPATLLANVAAIESAIAPPAP